MNHDQSPPTLANLNSHLANERTHLSYLRTSLSMISIGVTLNRLSIYLRGLGHDKEPDILHNTALFGVSMVVLGIVLMFWSMIRYHQIFNDINNSTFRNPFKYIVIMTSSVIVLGTLAVFWMLSSPKG